MDKRAILVLFAVTLALVGYILVYERGSLTSKELDERKGRVLTTFVRARVDRLELERKGKRLVVERTHLDDGELGLWKVIEPAKAEADEAAVDQVLGELEWLSARRTLEQLSAADSKSFGLDAPRYRVAYRAGGERHVLAVGNPDVHGEGVYARIDGEESAFVVPKTLTEALDHDPGYFRTKEFLGEMTIVWAKKLSIEASGVKHELVKEKERWWYTGAPKSYADDKRVDQLLRSLDDLRAARYLEGADVAPAQADLKSPARTVRMLVVPDEGREDKGPVTVELRLGGVCAGHEGERYAQAGGAGAPVCVEAEALKPFEPGPSDLRQTSLLGVDPSEVEGFELSSGTRKLALKREGEKWLPQGKELVDREAVEAWLADLRADRARAFVPVTAIDEKAALTLKLAGGKSERLVLGGPGPDGTVYVRRGDEPVLVTYFAGLADRFEPAAGRFASLAVWAAHQPSQVEAIQAKEGKLERKLVLADGNWRTESKASAPLDTTRVRELIKTLIKLQPRAFVSEQARPEHGLSAATARAELRLTGGAKLLLEVGAPTERGAYGRVDGAHVYELGADVLSVIRELAGGPAAPAAASKAADAGSEGPEEHDARGGHDDHDEHDDSAHM